MKSNRFFHYILVFCLCHSFAFSQNSENSPNITPEQQNVLNKRTEQIKSLRESFKKSLTKQQIRLIQTPEIDQKTKMIQFMRSLNNDQKLLFSKIENSFRDARKQIKGYKFDDRFHRNNREGNFNKQNQEQMNRIRNNQNQRKRN